MKRENLVWMVLILVGLVLVGVNAVIRGAGSTYVGTRTVEFADVSAEGDGPEWVRVGSPEALDHDLAAVPAEKRVSWTLETESSPRAFREAEAAAAENGGANGSVRFSLSRTIGVWVAAIFTLFIFSFLYADNPFYKVAESIVVGVSAAYWMVVAWWGTLVPNLLGNLDPRLVTGWAMPDFDKPEGELIYLVPLVLGVMLLWRLMPRGGWIARWPMAFIIGVFCGLRFVGFFQADFLSQIRATIIPIVVMGDTGFDLGDTIKNLVIIVGVLTCLVYFFFSIEHTGFVGRTARVGIWFLMITFGVGFGYTVMGRIALLAIRLEFLFDDWLWLIDPEGARTVASGATGLLWPLLGAG